MAYYIGTLDKDREVLYYGAEKEGVSTMAWCKEKENARSWSDHTEPSKLIQKLNVQSERFQFFLIQS